MFFADRPGENTPGPQDRRPTQRQVAQSVIECSEHRTRITELSHHCQSCADLVYADATRSAAVIRASLIALNR